MTENASIASEVLASLGFGPSQAVVEIDRASVPESPTGHGLALASMAKALPLAVLLHGEIANKPDYSTTTLDRSTEHAIDVSRWDHDASIAIVRCPHALLSTAPAASAQLVDGGDIAVDARDGPVYVRIETSHGSRVVMVGANETVLFGIAVPASPELESLRAWRPTPAEPVSIPSFATMSGSHDAPQWLRVQVSQHLEIGTPLSVAAGYGLLARLAPPTRQPIAAVLAAPPAIADCVNWIAGLSLAQRDALLAQVLDEADSLMDQLEPLADALARHDDAGRERARSWLHRRDDLASIAVVLRAGGVDTTTVNSALAQIDVTASTWQSMWSACEPFDDDERLCEVSWQEPDAWWGSLTLG